MELLAAMLPHHHHPLIRPCYLVSGLITLKLLIAWLDYYRMLAMLVQIPEGGLMIQANAWSLDALTRPFLSSSLIMWSLCQQR